MSWVDSGTAEDKQKLLNYCRGNVNTLSLTREDLDGEVLCSIDRLQNYRTQLIDREERLLPNYCDRSSFQNYVEYLWYNISVPLADKHRRIPSYHGSISYLVPDT